MLGPHFIIIGAMKSATSTLQQQLVLQPGIFMSTPKEPNFFSDDMQYARGLEWYEQLYSSAEPYDLSGEASTHYTKFPTYPDTAERLKKSFPNVRLVYIMRHPVERLISHYIHEWSAGVYSYDINETLTRHSELVSYSLYAYQLQPYIESFGRNAILPVFFDRLTQEPQEQLSRICQFIGYQGDPVWHTEMTQSNVSSERIRRFPFYSLLVESSFAKALRHTLIPQSLRNTVKNRLTIQKRPEISPPLRARLVKEFDKDLEQLGSMLGKGINCDSFKLVTSKESLEWVV